MKRKIFKYYFMLIALVIFLVALLSSKMILTVYQNGAEDTLIKIWGGSLFAIIILGLISALFAYGTSKSINKLLNKITLMANEISKGNYDSRIDDKFEDEFGTLVDAFNGMAGKLEMNISNLRDKKIEIQSIIDSISSGIIAVDGEHKIILINPMAREIFQINTSSDLIGDKIVNHIRNSQINKLLTETMEKNIHLEEDAIFMGDKILRVDASPIKTTNSELLNNGGIVFIQDITKLKKLEQLRTEFVSNVTHELKTPLTSIRGFIETLKNGSIKDPKRAARFLDIIDIEAERLYLLISDILQLSEIESKKSDVDISPICFKGLVHEVFEISRSIADEREVSLINNVDGDLIIHANRNRMKQLLLNLVNNAIKYNYEKGNVEVYGYPEPGKVTIGVKDSGIGIAEEHMSRIFERFYRVDKGRARESGGTGLGLSIVKHIVQLYNGDIKLKSEPGKGSEFIIQLPL